MTDDLDIKVDHTEDGRTATTRVAPTSAPAADSYFARCLPFHEAAHAVVAMHLGLRVRYVTINRAEAVEATGDPNATGHTALEPYSGDAGPLALVAFAGITNDATFGFPGAILEGSPSAAIAAAACHAARTSSSSAGSSRPPTRSGLRASAPTLSSAATGTGSPRSASRYSSVAGSPGTRWRRSDSVRGAGRGEEMVRRRPGVRTRDLPISFANPEPCEFRAGDWRRGFYRELNYRQHSHDNYTTGVEGGPGSLGGRRPRPNGGGILIVPVMGSRVR